MNKVIVRNQDEDYKVVNVDNEIELEFMQDVVQGYIERIAYVKELEQRNIDMWINEEGKLIEGLKPTFITIQKDTGKILDVIMGNVLFTSHDGEGGTVALNDMQMQYIKSKLKKAAVLNDGTIVNVIEV